MRSRRSHLTSAIGVEIHRHLRRGTLAIVSIRWAAPRSGFMIITSAAPVGFFLRPSGNNSPSIWLWKPHRMMNCAWRSAAGIEYPRKMILLAVLKYRVQFFHSSLNTGFSKFFEYTGGTIKIDFDARESKPGSRGLRNHGTKFRISPDDVCRLYAKKERFC